MGLIQRFKAAFSPRFDEIVRQYMAGQDIPSVSNVVISNEVSMRFSAVFACFRVLAETFASVPIIEYKKTDADSREKTDETGLYDMLHSVANEEMSAYNLKEALMYQLCAGGNAVAERMRNRLGEVVGLYPFEWPRVEITRDRETNRIVYKIDGGRRTLSRGDVFHLPGPSMNGINGMSILEYAATAIRLGASYDQFGQKFYQNAALPAGVFKHGSFLKPEAYDRLKSDLSKQYTGLNNSGKPMLLEDGLEYVPLTMKPVDAELLSSRKFQVEDICRFCRVPLHLVQNLDRATNNNIEHQSLEFVMYTMLPHFKRAEECINTQLLSRRQRENGYYFEFNVSALLRGDAKSMAEAFAVGRQWGWLSVNDIRRFMNMNGIPNGDIYLQPMNMIEAGMDPSEVKKPSDEVLKEIENLIQLSRG